MSRGTLLVIGHVLTVDFIGLVQKMVVGIQKHRLLYIAGAPFPFPLFRAFSLPPPPPLFALATQANFKVPIVIEN